MNDIEKLIEYIKDHSNNYLGSKATLKEIEAFEYFYNLLMDTLEKQLGGGWIPASERLPTIRECQENDCRFIVTDGNRRYQVWFDYEEGYFQKCECNGLGLKKDKCVIAWQPLPFAYKEVENEKNS